MKKSASGYGQQNRRAAEIIMKDPERYGGPESLMVQWALLVLSRVGAPPADAEAGPLFERWAA
jgi:hypothetical protein